MSGRRDDPILSQTGNPTHNRRGVARFSFKGVIIERTKGNRTNGRRDDRPTPPGGRLIERGNATRGIRNHDKITECGYTAHIQVALSVGCDCMGGNQNGADERGRLLAIVEKQQDVPRD